MVGACPHRSFADFFCFMLQQKRKGKSMLAKPKFG